jgi:hypothetical protein
MEPAVGTRPDDDQGIRVAKGVVDKLRELDRSISSDIAHAIQSIPDTHARRILLKVPGDPPDTPYWALELRRAEAPVIIYRAALPDENGGWLVTALMDRHAYRRYSGGLEGNTVVQGVAAVVAAGTISATGASVSSATGSVHLGTAPSPAAAPSPASDAPAHGGSAPS